MKILYIEANMGASGDMLLSSLYGLLDDYKKIEFKKKLKELNIPKVKFEIEETLKNNISGYSAKVLIDETEEISDDVDIRSEKVKKFENAFFSQNPRYKKVKLNLVQNTDENHHHHEHEHDHHHNEHDHHEHMHGHEHNHNHEHSHGHSHGPHEHTHSHNSLSEVNSVINGLSLDKSIKENALNVYKIIAEAEAKVHGKEISEVHFHEVGELDAIFDIVSVSLIFSMLNVDKVITSDVNLGSGFVKCAHGTLPVPAPATALIIQGMSTYSSSIKGELLTPTGAALLKHFTNEFSNMPKLRINKSSFGFGKKSFDVLNAVRTYIGELENNKQDEISTNNIPRTITNMESNSMVNLNDEEIFEVKCNIDDMTGEELSLIIDRLILNGALDAYLTQVIMKKSRPGIILTVLCNEKDLSNLSTIILKETTTLGVRYCKLSRKILNREIRKFIVDGEEVRVKISFDENLGIKKYKVEWEDILRISNLKNISSMEAKKYIEKNIEIK